MRLLDEVGTAKKSTRMLPNWLFARLLRHVDRLSAARAWGVPAEDLTDGELAMREMWKAVADLYSDDENARGLLAAIGADPDVILARP